MRTKEPALSITATSPSSASTAVHSTVFKGDMLSRADALVIDAILTGGTGGTLDVYLQRKIGNDSWRDLAHFPQVSAATTKRFTFALNGQGTSIVETGGGSDATPGVALAANTSVNVMPGGDVRIVFVAGAGTSAGASQTISITPYTERH